MDELYIVKNQEVWLFANVDKEIEWDYNNPSIADKDFEKLREEILNK